MLIGLLGGVGAGVVNALRHGRASGCRPSSPRSACSTWPAASPPGSSPDSELYRLSGELQSASAARIERHSALLQHRAAPTRLARDSRRASSACRRILMVLVSRSSPASCSATRRSARRSTPPAATSAPPTMPASTPTASRVHRLVFCALCAAMAGVINIAYLPQLQSDRRPVPRTRRHRRRSSSAAARSSAATAPSSARSPAPP